MTEYLIFAGNTAAALAMGAVLGLERQYGGHPAGLRTNSLVSVGAALFVSLATPALLNDASSPTRMASYVVSGLGFLGGGVILREGLNVRGMNTAATIWCAGAIGALCGSGFVLHALVGVIVILMVHIGLRPLAHFIDQHRKTATDVETGYRIRVTCNESEQALVRNIVLRHINSNKGMIVQGVSLLDCEQAHRAVFAADVFSHTRNDHAMEELVSRLNIEPGVVAVSWERRQ
jgi:putative Mg2+ transporter-C (MgtC) family protein